MAYYKAVLEGTYEGQQIVNTLYYRGVSVGALELIAPTNGEDVAFQIHQEIVPAWLGCQAVGYQLQTITVYPYNDALELAYSLPYVLAVNEFGTVNEGTTGPAGCWIFYFNIVNLPLINIQYPYETSLLAPRRGYIAFGPILDTWVNNAGLFFANGTSGALMIALADALGANLENAIPPAVFVPVRARTRTIAGVFTLTGFGGVSSVGWRSAASYRRSRQPG